MSTAVSQRRCLARGRSLTGRIRRAVYTLAAGDFQYFFRGPTKLPASAGKRDMLAAGSAFGVRESARGWSRRQSLLAIKAEMLLDVESPLIEPRSLAAGRMACAERGADPRRIVVEPPTAPIPACAAGPRDRECDEQHDSSTMRCHERFGLGSARKGPPA